MQYNSEDDKNAKSSWLDKQDVDGSWETILMCSVEFPFCLDTEYMAVTMYTIIITTVTATVM